MWSGLPGLPTDCDELRRVMCRRAPALNLVDMGAISALSRASALSEICSLIVILNDQTALALASGIRRH
jgi:hypothetical protein